jgi:5,10-methylenetetrahydromethanopterin reductase
VTRELGLGLQGDAPLAAYGPLARLVEEAGFSVVTLFNDLWFQPPLPGLLEVARATRRVRVGCSCHNPFTLHPWEIAGQVALLDEASDGRAFVGLAAGAWLDELGLEAERPLEAVREAWEVIRRLLSGDQEGYAGRRFVLPPGRGLRFARRRASVPLLVGAWGERLAAFAGAQADELKLGGSASPAMLQVLATRAGAALRARETPLRLVVGAVCVVDEDGAAARGRARQEVALYLPVVAARDPTVTLDPELLARLRGLAAREAYAEAGALVSDDLLDRFAFAGTPAAVAAQAEALFDAGAGRVELGPPHGLDQRRGMRLLAREVAPRLLRGSRPTRNPPLPGAG